MVLLPHERKAEASFGFGETTIRTHTAWIRCAVIGQTNTR
jgi:hypothetical protein